MTSPSAIIAATAVAALSEAKAIRTLLARHIAKLNNASGIRRAQGPTRLGITSSLLETLGEVVTVKVVVAAPLAGVTIAGLKVQVIPMIGEQENATVFVNPPAGVTVSMNCVD